MPLHTPLRHLLLPAVLAGLALLAVPAAAQSTTFPTRPVTLVVPFGPGSVTDMLARTLANRLAAPLGQAVVVDNRAGAGGNIGAGHVAASSADGYTLLLGTSRNPISEA